MTQNQLLYPAPSQIEQLKEDLVSFTLTQTNAIWQVNGQVLRAWLLLDEPLTHAQLCDRIVEFHAGADRQDCWVLVQDLIDKGLIETKASEANYATPELQVAVIADAETSRQRELALYLITQIAHTVMVVSETADADVIVCVESTLDSQSVDAKTILVCANHETYPVSEFDVIVSETASTFIHAQSVLNTKWVMVPAQVTAAGLKDRKAVIKSFGQGFDPQRLQYRLQALLGFETPMASFEQEGKAASSDGSKPAPFLTIGMATYDDYDGVYFSVTALALYHPEVMAQCEVVVLDNNPGGVASDSLKKLANTFSNLRYEPYGERQGTAVRDQLFEFARGEWVLCMDSHVMFAPGALDKLVNYLQSSAEPNELLQGPLIDDAGRVSASHLRPEWEGGFYGRWSLDDRAKDENGPPFEIDMQGLGSFVANRDYWPGFNPRFRGFGGEEGYIHQKFRKLGGRCLCLPFLRWAHRFERPNGPPYSVNWNDRVHNYLRGFNEVGLDVVEAKAHFRKLNVKHIVDQQEKALDAEKNSPFELFGAIACINLDHRQDKWQAMQERLKRLRIGERVNRISAVHTPENHHIGCALSHRKAIANAHHNKLENILVFEDDAIFLSGADTLLKMALRDFNQPWQLLYLGGVYQRELFDFDNDTPRVEAMPDGQYLTCTHAVAYHHSVFETLLNELPDNEADMVSWLKKHHAIDQYLHTLSQRWVVVPDLAQQRQMLWYINALSNYHYE